MKEDGKTIIYSGHSNENTLTVGLCLSLPVAKAYNYSTFSDKVCQGHLNSGTYSNYGS